MNPSIQALEGVYEHKMDAKCRVSVPTDWRETAGDGYLRLLQSSSYGLEVLRVVTETEYRNMLQSVELSDLSAANKKKMLGRLYSSCLKTTLNPQGKITIPKAWCELPSLEANGNVVMAGRGTYFELFKPERYQEMLGQQKAETDELDEDFGFF